MALPKPESLESRQCDHVPRPYRAHYKKPDLPAYRPDHVLHRPQLAPTRERAEKALIALPPPHEPCLLRFDAKPAPASAAQDRNATPQVSCRIGRESDLEIGELEQSQAIASALACLDPRLWQPLQNKPQSCQIPSRHQAMTQKNNRPPPLPPACLLPPADLPTKPPGHNSCQAEPPRLAAAT